MKLKIIFLALLFITPIFCTMHTSKKNKKVVVIGAGIAGLTVAYRLFRQEIDVQIYEARNRVGGRIFTAYMGNKIVELGGQNISDGGNAENVHRLIKEFDLECTESKINLDHSYFTKENLISIDEMLINKKFDAEQLMKQLTELAARSKNMKEVLDALFTEKDLLYKTIAIRLAAYEGASIENLSPIYVQTLYHMLLGGICSAHPEDEQCEKRINFLSIKGGNGLLLEKMASTIGNRLHLNKPLTHIKVNTDDSFMLTFADGEQVTADILVLAIPCSVYNDIHIDEVVISKNRLDSIKSILYGTNAKILIPFAVSPSKTSGVCNNRAVSFFDETYNYLTLYYASEASLFCPDTISDIYQQDKIMLEKNFGETYPSLVMPTFAQDKSFAFYDNAIGYSWPSDPYIKGSYSYVSPGQENLFMGMQEIDGEIVKVLFTPIAHKLYFVGEHTSILTDIPGTMEAACESGERIVRMILARLI